MRSEKPPGGTAGGAKNYLIKRIVLLFALRHGYVVKNRRRKEKKKILKQKRNSPEVSFKSLPSWISAGLSFLSSKIVWASFLGAKIDKSTSVALVSTCGVFVVVTETLDSEVFFGGWLTASMLFVMMVAVV